MTKYHRLHDLSTRNVSSDCSRDWKVQGQDSAGFSVVRAHFLACSRPHSRFPWCVPMERETELSDIFFYKGTNSLKRYAPSWLHLPLITSQGSLFKYYHTGDYSINVWIWGTVDIQLKRKCFVFWKRYYFKILWCQNFPAIMMALPPVLLGCTWHGHGYAPSLADYSPVFVYVTVLF